MRVEEKAFIGGCRIIVASRCPYRLALADARRRSTSASVTCPRRCWKGALKSPQQSQLIARAIGPRVALRTLEATAQAADGASGIRPVIFSVLYPAGQPAAYSCSELSGLV